MPKWKRSSSLEPIDSSKHNSCWKFWRHFVCTAGCYPALVAPIITAAFLLSLYSSVGCEFVDVSVGFTPSNTAWNESQADLGLFFYYDESAAAEEGNRYRQIFHNGCVWYDDVFHNSIVSRDRTWKVVRVISMVAASSGVLAVTTIWLLLLCPLPIGCMWPAILLPSTMLCFISEGSKFLLLDIALCRNAVWFPSGVDSLPERAESCTLGISGYIGVASGSIYLLALLLVCLNSPSKRKLDPNYGREFIEEPDSFLEAASTENIEYGNDNMIDLDDPSHHNTVTDPSPSSTRIDTIGTSIGSLTPETPDYGYQPQQPPPPPSDQYPFKPPAAAVSPIRTMEPDEKPGAYISESRMAVMSKMQLSTPTDSNEMIAQICSDLDNSLAPRGESSE